MNSSLYTGVLGLMNHQTRMDVIGNNIANVNTYGYKRGRASFADLLSRNYMGASAPTDARGGINPLQVGMGMTTSAVTNIMTQGQTEQTGNLTDAAINGNGWFVLQDGSGQQIYTRDGTFSLDRDGTYVSANGWKVQGWTDVSTDADHNFTVNTRIPVNSIDFHIGQKLAAEATNTVGLKCNLKSDSRSIISDGTDPKEGYATKDDRLVDLYALKPNEFSPTHLGVAEGDWVEIKAKVSYANGDQGFTTNHTLNQAAGIGNGIQQLFSIIPSTDLPVRINSITAGANTYNAANFVAKDPDTDNNGIYEGLGDPQPALAGATIVGQNTIVNPPPIPPALGLAGTNAIVNSVTFNGTTYTINNLVTGVPAAGQWSFDSATGTITLGTPAAVPGTYTVNYSANNNRWTYDGSSGQFILGIPPTAADNMSIDYDSVLTCKNTLPFQTEKYMYFQVTNDTKISDLETAIQSTLNALDTNGTINGKVQYDPTTAQFTIYNNAVNGSRDENELSVNISAVSGSDIRRGFLMQDSTDKNVKGTKLNIVDNGLNSAMEAENAGIVDYQNDGVQLDYGKIDSSTQLYAQVASTRLDATYSDGMASDGIQLNEWQTGYTQNNTLTMIHETDQLSVNGTAWTRVAFFTGAANEYVISDGNGTLAPTIYFSSDVNLRPTNNDDIRLTFRPANAAQVLLSESTAGNLNPNNDYTIDPTTGKISFVWSGASSDPMRVLGNKGLTGSMKITAQYTTEERHMDPTTILANSRWSDYAQAISNDDHGDNKGRLEFNNMFSAIGNGKILDQATSNQPTTAASSRFLSGAAQRTSITVYDSLGDAHQLQFVMTHVGSYYDTTAQKKFTNEWFWRAELPYSDVFAFDSMDMHNGSAVINPPPEGTLQFDDNGIINVSALAGENGPIMFDGSPLGLNGNTTGSVQQNAIRVDFAGHKNQSPIDGVTQYASDFTTAAFEQNGWAMGTLQTFAIDQNGIIQGTYSNNVVRPIAQMALALFPNEQGLTKLGENTFGTSANSGIAELNAAEVGGRGSISGSALEMSNVDIAQEFTDMIVTERGFQANSRVVTTSDEMLTEVINMKR